MLKLKEGDWRFWGTEEVCLYVGRRVEEVCVWVCVCVCARVRAYVCREGVEETCVSVGGGGVWRSEGGSTNELGE